MPPGFRRRLTGSIVATVVLVAFTFAVLAPPERCPDVGGDELREASTEAVNWFVRNQNDDGTWLYLYESDGDRIVADYNITRHAGAIMGLYQAATAGIDGAMGSADRGVEWVVPRLLRQDGWSAVPEGSLAPVGASALLAAGMADRRMATDDPRHDDLMVRLGRFMVAQTEPSGAMLGYYEISPGRPLAGRYSPYFTGEAWWALGRLHRLFPDAGFGEVADRVGTYIATVRDDAEDHFPPLPDHWAAYGLAETVEFPERASGGNRPLTDAEVGYARRQAGLFGAQVRWVSQRFGPWGWWIRGSHVPRGGGYGVVGEALTGLWRTSLADERLVDLRRPLADRATCIAALAVQRQERAADAEQADSPGRVRGAWFKDGSTRMDDQQHALSALLRTEAITAAAASGQEPGGGSSRSAPGAWLWTLVALMALNPARLALGAPREDGNGSKDWATSGAPNHPPPLPALTAVGTLAGAAVLLGVALAGDPLLDAFDVSEPAARIGAGVVAAALGLADLFRRPPSSHDAALEGWRAAVVPVAVPLVLRPALVVLALSAGADGRGWAVALAVGTGGALAALATHRPPSPVARRALTWAGRLAGAALVVAAAGLVVNGVFDV